MFKFFVKYTLLWSFILGAFLAILLFPSKQKDEIPKNVSYEQRYEEWFQRNGLQRRVMSMDEVRYGVYDKNLMESQFLFNHVSVLCVVLVRKRKNAVAANNTWGRHCNGMTFIYLQSERVQKTMLPIRQEKIESSWHLLCDAIRSIPDRYQWVLFVNDDMLAVPENVRYMVGGLDCDKGYYLGHAISFWGTVYNIAQAGYILSRGSIDGLKKQFNSTEACIAGGRFWKQEDFYLGKHLSNMGVYPQDTRDSEGFSTFHGYNLVQMFFPGSLPTFANYYKHSVYPVTCCSSNSITFQTIEADKMYTNYYMIYGVQLFHRGSRGNAPPPKTKPDDDVWMSFLREQGIKDMGISAEAYYELWTSIVNDPVHFNQNIKKWMNASLP